MAPYNNSLSRGTNGMTPNNSGMTPNGQYAQQWNGRPVPGKAPQSFNASRQAPPQPAAPIHISSSQTGQQRQQVNRNGTQHFWQQRGAAPVAPQPSYPSYLTVKPAAAGPVSSGYKPSYPNVSRPAASGFKPSSPNVVEIQRAAPEQKRSASPAKGFKKISFGQNNAPITRKSLVTVPSQSVATKPVQEQRTSAPQKKRSTSPAKGFKALSLGPHVTPRDKKEIMKLKNPVVQPPTLSKPKPVVTKPVSPPKPAVTKPVVTKPPPPQRFQPKANQTATSYFVMKQQAKYGLPMNDPQIMPKEEEPDEEEETYYVEPAPVKKTPPPQKSKAKKTSTEKPYRNKVSPAAKGVRFGSTTVTKFERTLGDNPCAQGGAPMGMAMDHMSVEEASVDSFESVRGDKKTNEQLRISLEDRREILTKARTPASELKRVEKELKEINESRVADMTLRSYAPQFDDDERDGSAPFDC
eukprot:CAMPEP_0178924498 /NCGR_PEP_ID=MMETSP0786-20121207/17366_1 /TAXON_ID=186022 /ORGANISM="Thalassionema frauenfeldii, Strain CCMP 1798" /LENGTH=466 /DNA_ID=CAMNT_0020599227 /DNA_START=45 /DNA_END=1445 /DNA_ORIENTATION=-